MGSSKWKRAEGEITFFFIMLTLVLYIIFLLMIIVLGENNYALEKITREMTNRISISASVLQAENETETSNEVDEMVENIFNQVKVDILADSELLFKGFLSKNLRKKIIASFTIERLIEESESGGFRRRDSIKDVGLNLEPINNYFIYAIYIDEKKFKELNGGKEKIKLVLFNYKPKIFNYVFIKVMEE